MHLIYTKTSREDCRVNPGFKEETMSTSIIRGMVIHRWCQVALTFGRYGTPFISLSGGRHYELKSMKVKRLAQEHKSDSS